MQGYRLRSVRGREFMGFAIQQQAAIDRTIEARKFRHTKSLGHPNPKQNPNPETLTLNPDISLNPKPENTDPGP